LPARRRRRRRRLRLEVAPHVTYINVPSHLSFQSDRSNQHEAPNGNLLLAGNQTQIKM